MPLLPETVSPQRYRRVVGAAAVSLALIIFTGAAVRLTASGLGCEDWPACSEDRFVPEFTGHAWIEFGNRLLSGVVALATIAAVLAARRRVPYRRDLMQWAWAMVAGVLAQIVLGGMTVKVDLHPLFVSAHYLLSIYLMWVAIVLWHRAGSETEAPASTPLVPHRVVVLSRIAFGLCLLVLAIGTLVSGTGPHGGDTRADRLTFDLAGITRVHSFAAWALVLSLVGLALRLPERRDTRLLIAVAVVQGAIGYLQYATGVPAGLVELHVIGSVAVFCAVLAHHLRLFTTETSDNSLVAEPAES